MNAIPIPDDAGSAASRSSVGTTPAPPGVGLRGVLIGLTLATGLVDAACYLGMGHVLVANMTGNVVFLGFALGGASGFSIPSFLVALASFLIGAVLGGRLATHLEGNRRRWLVVAAALETLLGATAAIATAAGALGPSGGVRFGVIALLGLATGLQNATVRRLGIPDLTTTVLTMTLTGVAADSTPAGGSNPHLLRRVTAVVAMLLGAIIGGLLMTGPGFTATLAVTAGVFAATTVGFAAFADAPAPRASAAG